MPIIIRRLTTTASGRAIVRETRADSPSVIIGRNPAHGVNLEDLAVLPAHAQLTISPGERIAVSALDTLDFVLDGKRTSEAEFFASAGGELRFGSHRITVTEEEGAVVLTVERTGALSHSALDRDEARAFSLAGKLPGRRLSAWGFALLVLAAFLVAPILAFQAARGVEERSDGFHADQSWSSGPLSSAHHSLARDCQSCHVEPFVAVRDTACVGCHDDAHDHARPDRLLAARGTPEGWRAAEIRVAAAFNRPQGRCVDCHTEHEGAGPMPATAQRFCTDCHADMDSRLTDTRIANAGDFGTSHPQFRPRVVTAPATGPGLRPTFARIRWTPTLSDQSGLRFPHNMHLSRTNGVAQMARRLRMGPNLDCASCHQPTADGVRFQPVDMERDCQQCHALSIETVGGVVRTLRHGQPEQVVADLYAYYRSTPPRRPMLFGNSARRRPGVFFDGQAASRYAREIAVRPARADAAVRAVFSRNGACGECHVVTPPARGNTAWRVMPVHQTQRYLTGGWFDHGPHDDERCTTCHEAGASARASDLLVPGISTCRECHGGEGSSADVPSSCAMCHEYHADPAGGAPWRPDRRRNDSGGNDRVTLITDSATRRLYADR
jgi:predicted CXXCH cytochrome family protein